MSAAMLQLVTAGPIGRLLLQDAAPGSRIAFDLYSLGGACLGVYLAAAGRAPFLPVAIAIALVSAWMIFKAGKGWLGRLSFVWIGSVALVLASAIRWAPYPFAATWILLLCAAVLAVRAALRQAGGESPSITVHHAHGP